MTLAGSKHVCYYGQIRDSSSQMSDYMAASAQPRPRSGGKTERSRQESRDLLNYRLGDRSGQEELATLYRATHLALDRPVTVAVLRRPDWISTSRFQLSARLAARLNHPNIVPVIDAGHDDRYGDYMVMPQLDARPLTERLEAGPLDPLLALRIFTQIGAALDFLHSQEIAHRDLQPANVLLTPQGTAYLTNFSLAAASDTPDFSGIEEADLLTPYAAPEQTLLRADTAPAQDLYSLGVLLYQMLSGALPPRPGAEIPLLAAQNLALAGVDRVIQRLLDPRPEQRFASALQATAALRQALRQQIDVSTEDMHESRWDTVAEWLENPLETIAAELINHDYLSRSRARADALHRVGVIPRLLDRWSRQGFLRRQAIGQLIQYDQVLSYNIYTYELRVHYETRTALETRRKPYTEGQLPPAAPPPDRWVVPVPDLGRFVDAAPEPIVLPGSQHVVACSVCNGAGKTQCKSCGGHGEIVRAHKVRDRDGTTREETIRETCPTCRGYRDVPCQTCAGTGNLLEEQLFTWSRRGKLFLNEDDLSGLPVRVIQANAEQVFEGPIDLRDPRWYQVAPLKEILEQASNEGGGESRAIAADLIIRGVPVTEVDYQYRNATHTLTFIGFQNLIRGDLSLHDHERMLLYTVIVVMAIILSAMVLLGWR